MALRDIRLALLDADVALPVVKQFASPVRERALGEEVSQALNPAQQVVKIVNEELVGILGGETRTLRFAKKPPTVIMLAGLQGSGKTTLAGKLAHWLKGPGAYPAARRRGPPATERRHPARRRRRAGRRAGVRAGAGQRRRPRRGLGYGGGDAVVSATRSRWRAPASSRRGARQYDVVIVDTAGRLAVDADLMQQAADIRAAIQPDEVLFVIDAMIGQAAVETAQAFQEGVDFTGVVLSKLDGDARGGAALSVASVTGRPIMFADRREGQGHRGVPPRPDGRRASSTWATCSRSSSRPRRRSTSSQADEMARKFLAEEDFTFEDFLQQMKRHQEDGLAQVDAQDDAGHAGQMRDQLDAFDDREFDRVEAMVRSMTPFERTHPKQINGSRRARIAKGSGVTVTEVNQLLERFGDAQKMMKSLARGGGMPGMPGMPGVLRHGQARPPAAAAAEEEQERQPGQARGGGAGRRPARDGALGGAFGVGIPSAPIRPRSTPPRCRRAFEKFLGNSS